MNDKFPPESIIIKGADCQEKVSKTSFFDESEKEQLLLCNRLSISTSLFGSTDAGEWLNDLSHYRKKYKRLRYADISNYVFSNCQTETQETEFTTNLDTVFEYVQNHYDKASAERKELFEWFIKFRDHVTLALHQAHFVNAKEESLKSTVEDEVSKQMTSSTNEIMSQLVGLISIFTALSFVLFGGISSLESIFNYLGGIVTENSRWFHILPPVIIALIWTFCMINMLFVFVIFVMRIINRPLREGEASSFRALLGFPVLVNTDCCLIVIAFLLSFVYFVGVTKTGAMLVTDFVNKIGYLVFLLLLVLIVLACIVLCFFLRRIVLGTNTDKNQSNTDEKRCKRQCPLRRD